MHALSPLIPVAASAIHSVTHHLQDAWGQTASFARELLAPAPPETPQGGVERDEAIGPDADNAAAQRVRWEVLRQQIQTLSAALHRRLTEQLGQLRVDLSEPATLRVDSNGRVLEMGGHWDRARIEQAFEANSDLRHGLTELMRQAEALGRSSSDAGSHEVRPAHVWVVDQNSHRLQSVG